MTVYYLLSTAADDAMRLGLDVIRESITWATEMSKQYVGLLALYVLVIKMVK